MCDDLSRIFDSAIPHFVVLNFKFVFLKKIGIKNTLEYQFNALMLINAQSKIVCKN